MQDAVRSKILGVFGEDSLSNKILSHGCQANLKGISVSDRLIVDVDRYVRGMTCRSKRCDFILFIQFGSSSNVVCVLIELKSGVYTVREVVEKLQRTALYLERSLKLERSLGVDLVLCPLLLCTRGPHSTEQRKFERSVIHFGGSSCSIFKGRCGFEENIIETIGDIFDDWN